MKLASVEKRMTKAAGWQVQSTSDCGCHENGQWRIQFLTRTKYKHETGGFESRGCKCVKSDSEYCEGGEDGDCGIRLLSR